ncbi:putative leucine-rich repeat receptor-like serine/threonine-protein kinase [Prunus yedoensis var. nudiflora]|uniref:Putative leucine-rich repeat receptor-like serine/threonine-protein kinase n=1 Tax=Prunus yedoensis var. nudiflora TaxID=2094558 RepID=A0A314UGE2_PRUYE|nr:putative leucine-rich repeat receptor-like serine/threonine-protein kinase [Prunus yedoensis var. nudiflora]
MEWEEQHHLQRKGKSFYLLDWAQLLKGQGNLMDLVDPRLGSDFNKEEMMLTINVALLCCNVTSTVRPTMSSVVSMLEGRAAVQELVSDPNASSNEIEAMRKHFQSSLEGTPARARHKLRQLKGPGPHRSWYIKSFEREWWKISILLQNNVALNLSWNINMSVGRHELAD